MKATHTGFFNSSQLAMWAAMNELDTVVHNWLIKSKNND